MFLCPVLGRGLCFKLGRLGMGVSRAQLGSGARMSAVHISLYVIHSCQPLLGVNLSPEFVNLYFPYAGRGLWLFCWWQRHFEFQPAHVAVEGRSNVVLNTLARLQISFPMRLLSLCTRPVSVHLAMACVGCFLLSFKQNKIS